MPCVPQICAFRGVNAPEELQCIIMENERQKKSRIISLTLKYGQKTFSYLWKQCCKQEGRPRDITVSELYRCVDGKLGPRDTIAGQDTLVGCSDVIKRSGSGSGKSSVRFWEVRRRVDEVLHPQCTLECLQSVGLPGGGKSTTHVHRHTQGGTRTKATFLHRSVVLPNPWPSCSKKRGQHSRALELVLILAILSTFPCHVAGGI